MAVTGGTEQIQRDVLAQGFYYARQTIDQSLTVPAGYVFVNHDVAISNGTTLFLADGATLLLL